MYSQRHRRRLCSHELTDSNVCKGWKTDVSLVVWRPIQPIPQCHRSADDRGNVEALLALEPSAHDAANEPQDHSTEDKRFHRCALHDGVTDLALNR